MSGLENIAKESMSSSERLNRLKLIRGQKQQVVYTTPVVNAQYDPVNADVVKAIVVEYNPQSRLAYVKFPNTYRYTNANIEILPEHTSKDFVGKEVKAVVGFHYPFDRVLRAYDNEKNIISNSFPNVIYNRKTVYHDFPKP